MGLLGHIRVHESEIPRCVNSIDTPRTPSAPAILTATAITTTTNNNTPDPPNFSCHLSASNFPLCIGLVDHLRIHRTDTGEQVHGAPTYSHRAHIHFLHHSPHSHIEWAY
ncbi:unnamed protein product [Schistocephalus solidus]|uniref:C2H2-type domain-containing protein n=1 Tax=Schistocephalus solidus TaxID=70667 RepID=A0A183SEU6_SCHSO|nr:unnamed protein product [Schistocephalus solidus]